MKKMLALLTAALLTAGAATAQTTPAPASRLQQRPDLTPEQRADAQAQRLTKQLGLTADQTPKVRALVLAQVQELQTLRGKYAAAGSRQGMGPELKAAQDTFETQLKAVLTADQYSSYAQLREDRQDQRRAARGNRP
jgi:periplasmic protein CpxP/Spy